MMSADPIASDDPKDDQVPAEPPAGKLTWQPPKLTFVEPKLTKEGDLEEVTGQGFFGTFVP
jgi:hypothetical protein